MPVSNAKLEKLAPNSIEKRETTWKQGQCQMCLTKVPTAKQKKLVNDLENGKVKIGKADEQHSHYCEDCADRRKSMKENWLARRDGEPAPKKSAKKGKAKKAAAAKPAKKAKAAKRPPKKVAKKRPAKKAAAKAGADPF